MNDTFRKILVFPLCGLLWYAGMLVFFVFSGAQHMLANPEHQSAKFLEAFFTTDAPPRMAGDNCLVIKGLLVAGFFMAAVLVFLNGKLGGPWYRKGLQFGLICWALAIPWFEFYLPYNVMREPLSLALFEAALWLGVMLSTGICVSFALNFRRGANIPS